MGRMSNTATAQSCDREGRTKSKGLKEPLTQQAKGSEDNLKGWQTNHQKRILNNPTITYGSIQSGNSRQIGVTQALTCIHRKFREFPKKRVQDCQT